MSIKNLLRDEIQDEMGHLGKLEVGSEPYRIAVEGVTKLVDRVVELEKIEANAKERAIDREIDMEFKQQQIDNEERDRKIKNGIAVASLVTGTGLTVWGALKSWKFEETGTVTSAMGKMFMNCFRPKR